MKKSVCFYLAVFITLQFVKLLFINEIIEDYGEGRIEIHVNESAPMHFEAFAFNEGYKRLQPTVISLRPCIVRGKEEMEVLGIAVNEYFMQTHPLQMKNGDFFGEGAVGEGRNVSVISDELAIKLFGSEKATGNIYEVEDTPYQVVGVYKKYKNFWGKLFDDGQERIYYPITSEEAQNGQIEILSISLKNRQEEISIH